MMNADKKLQAKGLACIYLTPEIKKTMSEMQSGEVLEVSSDDSASREGIPAWCRLTGHTLLQTEQSDADLTTYFIRKK